MDESQIPVMLEVKLWATGVHYVLTRRAVVEFPTTSASRPSYWVQVSLAVGGQEAYGSESRRGLFPFRVRWDIWDRVLAPLIQERQGRQGGLTGYDEALEISLLVSEIRHRLVAEGYLPAV